MQTTNVTEKHRKITIERIDKFLSNLYFTDCNLYGRIYGKSYPISSIYHIPNTEGLRKRFNEISKLFSSKKCEKTKIGDKFGPSWSTHWFKITFEIPNELLEKEIHFLWNCSAESMLYSENGEPIQSFTGTDKHYKKWEYILTKKDSGEKVKKNYCFFIELSCNGLFGNARDENMISPPTEDMKFELKKCELSVFNRDIYSLYVKTKIIFDLSKELENTNFNRSYQALITCNNIINEFRDENDVFKCCGIADEFLSKKTGESVHNLFAVGHSHLDVAWLWSYKETKDKAARTFCSQCKLMDEYPDYQFVQSQSVLFEWIKIERPLIWKKVVEKISKNQFIVVGGSYVEFDGNLPSGESMCRQFLVGQDFFSKNFGKKCEIFWLPDSFGFSAQLPQIMKKSNIKYFLSQKLSWNLINKFPHTTFFWEGLDGSKVLSHFPPADTYCSEMKISEVLYSVKNCKDKGRINSSLLLFGHGDGGAGPKREHLDVLKNIKNCDGLPKIFQKTPHELFDYYSQKKVSKNLLTWKGELYFELHRGVYTSQAATKRGNRKSEVLLRNLEIICSLLSFKEYPKEKINELWKLLLLNQFHDVLPGSSIEKVYKDSRNHYKYIEEEGKRILFSTLEKFSKKGESLIVFNTLNWPRNEIIEVKEGNFEHCWQKNLVVAKCSSIGLSVVDFSKQKEIILPNKLKIFEEAERLIMQNDNFYLTIHLDGTIDLFDYRVDRKTVFKGNKFVMYEDIPLYWDAWDAMIYHLEKEPFACDAKVSEFKILERGPLRISVEFKRRISGKSWIKQVIRMNCFNDRIDFINEIEWNESRKFLKVLFPTSIQNDYATYEIQFGHLNRTTLKNTSNDISRFEVSNQKWFDLSEYGYGLSVLNDSKYGCSILNKSTLVLSLLRSPKKT